MKRHLSVVFIVILLVSILAGCGSSTTDISVAAMKGPTAMGLVKLMDDSEKGNTGDNSYTFAIEGSPDAVTPGLIQGTIDIAAVPANLASVLYNKTEGGVTVLAVNTLGVLYIVENGDTVSSVSDLKGRTIYASGKGSTPEYALNYMLKANGIDPEKDVTIEYKSEHAECVSAITENEDALAILPQPFVTTAMMTNDNIKIALDMNSEWDKAAKENGSDASLLTGVIVARTEFVKSNPKAVKLFLKQYEESVKFTNEHSDEAAALIENYDIIKAAVAIKAIPYCNITFITGDELKKRLGGYLEVLFGENPAALGGALPNEDFYYNN